MSLQPDPCLILQFPYIRRIIADETWLEGERRGHWVSADDPVVQAKVCDVILRVGDQLRDRARAALTETEATVGASRQAA